jgi:hypothetical protein
METRFGADFGDVRVHADASAERSARSVSAHAYTVGPHIAFAPGRYAPHTSAGRRLLAHELAHVVQQRSGAPYVARACDHATTGRNDADAVIEHARNDAVRFVNDALAEVNEALQRPQSWRGFIGGSRLERHFHCPQAEHVTYIRSILRELAAALPNEIFRCVAGNTPGCNRHDRAHFGPLEDQAGHGALCPSFFGDPSEIQAGELIALMARLLGQSTSCPRQDGCYNDFRSTGPGSMMHDFYAYGYFSASAAGHEVVPEPPGGVTCAPQQAPAAPATAAMPAAAPPPSPCHAGGRITSRFINVPAPPERPRVAAPGDANLFEERRDARGLFICVNGTRIDQTW